ncbi:extensin family protein [Roseibium sp. HPY-6]|uniref:extensin-like domain-containing protein n=1 Tax=Roseibium sp. HPY-6 TaxID=3229852 RepID=UPI00338E9424
MIKTAVVSLTLVLAQPVFAASSEAAAPLPTPKPLAASNSSNSEKTKLPAPKPEKAKKPKSDALVTAHPDSCVLGETEFTTIPAIRGEHSGDAGCGIEAPVKLTGVAWNEKSVQFKNAVTVSCEFAQVYTAWLRQDVMPLAEKHFDGGLETVRSGPGYQCRRRNNQPGGKLSEHALGKAVDISHFHMQDGTSVSIEKDWGQKTKPGRFLKALHKSACKRFTTVLSPEGDEFHKSHLHLDIGCHGKTCTYLICQ